MDANKPTETKKDLKERNKTRRETLGKFFYDLAKVSFTVLVVGIPATLLKTELYDNEVLIALIAAGIAFTLAFAKIGDNILK